MLKLFHSCYDFLPIYEPLPYEPDPTTMYDIQAYASILCTNWHPIAACLWGLTRRRINRFKYGRFSISSDFHI